MTMTATTDAAHDEQPAGLDDAPAPARRRRPRWVIAAVLLWLAGAGTIGLILFGPGIAGASAAGGCGGG